MQWLTILFLALLLVLTVIRFQSIRRVKRRQEKRVPMLREVLPDGVVVRPRMLLYFYSEHCSACRTVTPLIDELHRRRDGVVKVDVRRHLVTARHFGIKSTPSLVLLEDGHIAGVHVGIINPGSLQQFYEGTGIR